MHLLVLFLGVLSSAYLGECAITSWTSPVQAGTGGEITTAILTVAEGYTGTFITFAATTDATSVTAYAVEAQTPNTGEFEIPTPANGVLALASGKVLDYETAQSHVLKVTAVDNTGTPATGTVTVTIVVTNVAPAFSFTTQTVIVADATVANTDVATIAAVDVGATLTYAITTASNTNTDFAISSSGVVSTAKVLAAATTSLYTLVITAADNVATIATGTTILVVCVGTACPATGSGAAGLAAGVLSLITLAVTVLK